MAFTITKSYTPVAGQQSNSGLYNTDIATLFNTVNGLQAQTTSIGGLTIIPSADGTRKLDVQNLAGTTVFAVDTTSAQIYSAQKMWWLVSETTLAAAATSITIPGLNGDADGVYFIVGRIIQNYSGIISYFIRPNNDSTNGNYYWGGNDLNNGITATTGLAIIRPQTLNSVGGMTVFNGYLFAKSGGYRGIIMSWATELTSATGGQGASNPVNWTNTSDNITSLVFFSDQTNGFGIGTNIQVWCRK